MTDLDNLDNLEGSVRRSIQASIAVKQLLLNQPDVLSAITRATELIIDVFRKGNKVLLLGNGGSAADAQHIAAEFVGRFALDRPALPALALNANSSSITAIANDSGFDLVFARQIEALGRAGDLAVGISTSGRSPNIIQGMLAARKMGLHTLGLTGSTGEDLRKVVNLCISVPSASTPRVQECHILIGHIIAELVERTLFPGKSDAQE